MSDRWDDLVRMSMRAAEAKFGVRHPRPDEVTDGEPGPDSGAGDDVNRPGMRSGADLTPDDLARINRTANPYTFPDVELIVNETCEVTDGWCHTHSAVSVPALCAEEYREGGAVERALWEPILTGIITELRRQHVHRAQGVGCIVCNEHWPCPTIRAVERTEAWMREVSGDE